MIQKLFVLTIFRTLIGSGAIQLACLICVAMGIGAAPAVSQQLPPVEEVPPPLEDLPSLEWEMEGEGRPAPNLPGAIEQRDGTSGGEKAGGVLPLDEVRGVNYIPSYAASSKEIWLDFDAETIARELDYARAIGFNAVRVPLSYNAFELRPSSIYERFPEFLELCRERDLKVMPVLFDSWGVDEADLSEGSETAEQAYRRFIARPDAYRMSPTYNKYIDPLATEITPEIVVPRSNDPGVVFWRGWSPTPGHERLGRSFYDECREYLEEVIEPHGEDELILAWDIMNEPSTIRSFSRQPDVLPAFEFADAMVIHAKSLKKNTRPVTVGAASGRGGTGRFELRVDFVSVHSLEGTTLAMRRDLRSAQRGARGRPVLFTIAGATFFPTKAEDISEARRAREVRQAVQVANREDVGYFLWQLMKGEAMTPWTGLVEPDGTFTTAAEWLKDHYQSLEKPAWAQVGGSMPAGAAPMETE